MKLIGLLGGKGWESTIEYYRFLNEQVAQKLGRNHSARIILYSPDYEDMKQFSYDEMKEKCVILKKELMELANCLPDCILLCNNTLHKAYDELRKDFSLSIPVLHIVELTGQRLKDTKMKRVLLLGTSFTMEDGFFEEGLKKYGITCVIPPKEARGAMQDIHDKLLLNGPNGSMKDWFKKLIIGYEGKVDAVLLACTELQLLIEQKDFSMPIVNTVEIHCTAAVHFAIA